MDACDGFAEPSPPTGRSAAPPVDEYIEIDPGELTEVIRVPQWLRDVGTLAWILVGIAIAVLGLVWLLGLTQVIVVPVITAAVVAAVAAPLVR